MIRSSAERFWGKVEKRPSGCWEWTGARHQKQGYGVFGIRPPDRPRPYRMVMAHRFAYELLVAPIPEGLEIDHLCRNTCCVNPAHLEVVTHLENMRRRVLSDGPTRCPQGHPFDEANTGRRDGGRHRYCKTCNRVRANRYYHEKVKPAA